LKLAHTSAKAANADEPRKLAAVQAALEILAADDFGVLYRMTVASAHRSPTRALSLAGEAKKGGVKVIVAAGGMAAHLAGVVAAHTELPVIGVPIDAGGLGGLDALLSTVQMPPGVPVATMGIGGAGARNAAYFALRVLALSDPSLSRKLSSHRKRMAKEVEAAAKKVETGD